MITYLAKQFGMIALGLGLLAGGVEVRHGLAEKAAGYRAQADEYIGVQTACKTMTWALEASDQALKPAKHGNALPTKEAMK